MNEESFQEKEEKLTSAIEKMSKEEIVQVISELMRRSEESENSSKFLATHLKVLCYKNGGNLSYTKDEFDAAAKDDFAFSIDYEMHEKKEICMLRLQPRQKKDDQLK